MDIGAAVGISLDSEVGSHDQSQVALESLLHLNVKVVDGHFEDDVKAAGDDVMLLFVAGAVQAVPAAGGVVALVVADTVAKVLRAVNVKVGAALHNRRLAVAAVKETLLGAAALVAVTVLEHFPARLSSGCGVAMLPGVDSGAAVVSIKVAELVVTLRIAVIIALLGSAVVLHALLPLDVGIVGIFNVGLVNASWRRNVVDIAVLAPPFVLAIAIIVSNSVVALAVLARVVSALVSGVLLAGFAGGSRWAVADKLGASVGQTGSSVLARIVVTDLSRILTVGTVISWRTSTFVLISSVFADAAIFTRAVLAKVALGLAVPALPAWFAIALVVVGQLNAFLGSKLIARARKTFVDISLTSGSDKARSATAFVASNLINASSSVMTSSLKTLVDVNFTELTHGSMRTRTSKGVDQIVANSIVLARVGVAVIDVVFTVLALESWRTLALIGTNEIFAGGSVLTRLGGAFVDFILTVASIVAFGTSTLMAVSNVSAMTSVQARISGQRSSLPGSNITRNLSDVTKLASPAFGTRALEACSVLTAATIVFTRIFLAPIDQSLAVGASSSMRTVASIVALVVDAGASIATRVLVTLIDSVLTVGSSVSMKTDTGEIVDPIDASATIHARTFSTVLVVCLASCSGKSSRALTSVRVYIIMTSGSVETRVRGTLIDVILAEMTSKAINAIAFESIYSIMTSSSIQAGLVDAIINVEKTVSAFKAGFALAGVASLGVCAGRPVTARIVEAFVNVLVAVTSGEPKRA